MKTTPPPLPKTSTGTVKKTSGIALCRFYDYFLINPTISQMLSFYGMIHVVASALGFLSQGSIGWGFALTGIGYLVFTVIFLR